MFEYFVDLSPQGIFSTAVNIFFATWPIWAPLIAVEVAFHVWMDYKRREWIKGQGSVLLEIKLPKEMLKSPALMESVLQVFHQSGVGTLTDVYLKGRVRSWFSLELVSDGGQVHFYVWMHSKWRKTVESQIYAQFPNVEIFEAEDYALKIPYDPAKYKFSKMAHMVLTKSDAYPIRTYVDFGLDKDPKEEFKNDPIAPMIEFLGSLKPGEHAWIQIMIQAHTKEGIKYGRLVPKPDWKKAAEGEIATILKGARLKSKEEKAVESKHLSEAQKDTISAIERSIEKSAFDSMIRVMYFAEKEVVNPNNIGGLLGSFKTFSSNTLNGFRPGWSADYDYPWQDFLDMRRTKNEKEMLEAYKRRSFFNQPFKHFHDKPYVLTTEEVATLYHFPSSMVVATPTLSRIPSKKAEAPSNLPI